MFKKYAVGSSIAYDAVVPAISKAYTCAVEMTNGWVLASPFSVFAQKNLLPFKKCSHGQRFH